jgi:hypothetical protein
MNRDESLLALYRKWLEFATFENRVIQDRKWNQLNIHAKAKLELMKSVQDIERDPSLPQEPHSNELRLLIHQLADLEQLNGTLIRERMAEVKIQISDFQRNVRKVQQIRKRYEAPSRTPGGGRISRQA